MVFCANLNFGPAFIKSKVFEPYTVCKLWLGCKNLSKKATSEYDPQYLLIWYWFSLAFSRENFRLRNGLSCRKVPCTLWYAANSGLDQTFISDTQKPFLFFEKSIIWGTHGEIKWETRDNYLRIQVKFHEKVKVTSEFHVSLPHVVMCKDPQTIFRYFGHPLVVSLTWDFSVKSFEFSCNLLGRIFSVPISSRWWICHAAQWCIKCLTFRRERSELERTSIVITFWWRFLSRQIFHSREHLGIDMCVDWC